MREAEVGRQCDALAETLGWTVERYEQGRATRITEGLPDRRYVRAGQRVWVELKAPLGRLTTHQYGWLLSELDAGGLATVIHSQDELAYLFSVLARRSSIMEARARDLCREWVALTWQRGPREGRRDGRRGAGGNTTPRRLGGRRGG
jgi:hypothetical protein